MKQKRIGITLGDPGGIGSEIVLKALKKRHRVAKFILIGSGQALQQAKKRIKLELPLAVVSSFEELEKSTQPLLFWDIDRFAKGTIQIGKTSRVNGAKAFKALCIGEELARKKWISALVTAPLSKAAVRLVSPGFIGHTEFLAQKSKSKKYAMLFVGSRFLAVLATIHLPLKKVAGAISSQKIFEKIELTADFLKKYHFTKKEIAVCALNPHGRETGEEEDQIITPAILRAKRFGLQVSGPHPADRVFYEAFRGDYGAVLAMYHDQALAPFKMVSFRDGVNVTLGLPYLRTSPDHGTAFDIAYRGKADPASFLSALDLALKLGAKT